MRRPLATFLATTLLLFHPQAVSSGPAPPEFAERVSFVVNMPDMFPAPGLITIERCVPHRLRTCRSEEWLLVEALGPIDVLPGHEPIYWTLNPRWWNSIDFTIVEWSRVSNPEWAIRFHRDASRFDSHHWHIECTQDKTDPAAWLCLADVSGGWVPNDNVAEYLRKQWDNGPIPFTLTVQSWTRAYDGEEFCTVSTAPDWEPWETDGAAFSVAAP